MEEFKWREYKPLEGPISPLREDELPTRESFKKAGVWVPPQIVLCAQCKHWGDDKYEWDGLRPCDKTDWRFFVGGGDCNDGLYTAPDFGCVAGEI